MNEDAIVGDFLSLICEVNCLATRSSKNQWGQALLLGDRMRRTGKRPLRTLNEYRKRCNELKSMTASPKKNGHLGYSKAALLIFKVVREVARP